MGYLLLAGAIAAETFGTLCLRAAEGSKPAFIAATVVGYVTSFVCLSLALQQGLHLGAAYGVWAAAGVASVAILSAPLFGETLSAVQVVGIGIVIVGVFAIELG